MSTPFIGLSSAAKGRERLYAYQSNTAGLKEGAVFMFDSGAAGFEWSPDGRRLAVIAKADKSPVRMAPYNAW